MIDEIKTRELAGRLIGEIKISRQEGMTDLEVGAAIGIMLANVVPDAVERKNIEIFAARHVKL